MADTTTMINNGRDWYELADTMVKIGLGALIAGGFSYLSLRSTHKHEFSKEKFNQKISMLNNASDALEKFFFTSHKLIDQWYGMTTKKITKLEELSKTQLNTLLDIDDKRSKQVESALFAISKLNILGLKDVSEDIIVYDQTIVSIRNDLI